MSSDSPALPFARTAPHNRARLTRTTTDQAHQSAAQVLGWGLGARLVIAGICAAALWAGFAYVTAGSGF